MILALILGPDSAFNGPVSALSRTAPPTADVLVLALALIVGAGMAAMIVWMLFFRGRAKRLSPTMRRRLETQPLPAASEDAPT